MEKELFTILRLGLGNSTPEEENLSDFIMMSEEHWAHLGEKALEQGVLGIVMDGLERLETSPYGPTRALSKQQKLEWIGQVMQIEQRDRHQIEMMNDLAQKWIDGGCKVMVMKGQANGTLYPKEKVIIFNLSEGKPAKTRKRRKKNQDDAEKATERTEEEKSAKVNSEKE